NLSSCDLIISHRLTISEQGQVNVTGIKTSGQTANLKPLRVCKRLLHESDSG
ncbi:hypothetical protein M9458_017407, partial [Cirrhinus mrigala]